MKIPKAIEILGFIKQERIPLHQLDELHALNLGIKALKRVLEQRNPDGWLGNAELPGEEPE